jgi:hypothetical protein
MHDNLPSQEARWYAMLGQVVQNHATTERLGAWNIYMATLSVLAAVCREWCARGTAPPSLLAHIADALKAGLAPGTPQAPFRLDPLSTPEAVAPTTLAATQRLTCALAVCLGDVGWAHGLSLDGACQVAVWLVRDALLMLRQDQALGELETMIDHTLVGHLTRYLRMEASRLAP